MNKQKPAVVMLSDFGINSGFVSCMHGMCKMVDPTLETYDITHLIPAFDIVAASYCLQYTVPYWPAGTVFVSVVDPGVGTNRRACVAKLKNGSYVVTPDNGTLSYLHHMIGVSEIREIDETINRYPATKDVHVFHGRDLFAYCAARLAAGIITYEQVGKAYPLEEMVLHAIQYAEVSHKYVKASIQGYDPFGNTEISVLNTAFQKTGFVIGDVLHVKIFDDRQVVFDGMVPYEKSFGYVPQGDVVLFQDLASYVTIACNADSFAQTYHLDPAKTYTVEICEAK